MMQKASGVVYEDGVDIPTSSARPAYRMEGTAQRFGLIKRLLTGELPDTPSAESNETCPDGPTPSHIAKFRTDDSGAFEIYPSFKEVAQLKPTKFVAKHIEEVGRKITHALVPRDEHTTALADEGRVLTFARRDLQGPEVEVRKARVLLYVSARRLVDGLFVDGPGSRITVAVSGAQKVFGAVYDWKMPQEPVAIPARSREAVRADIEAQLLASESRNDVRVKRIELAYYDNGRRLEPVYRFVAEFDQDAESFGAPDLVVGYVPFDPKAEVPTLGSRAKSEPRAEDLGSTSASALRVGRYIVRDLYAGWKESADAFWDVLARARGSLEFSNAQREDARPSLFAQDKAAYIDKVDIALLEAHGLPFGFSTKGDAEEVVLIDRDVAGRRIGYGFADGGNLKHWCLHACNAVSTEAEFPRWADEWGPIFKGLSTIVGYRSVMFVNDGAPAAFAASIAAGAPVVSAWFNAVTSLNIYAADSEVKLRCAGAQPLGRPSAVFPLDHVDDTATDAGPGKVGQLDSWWIETGIQTTSQLRDVPGAEELGCSPDDARHKDCPKLGPVGSYPPRT